VESQRGMTAGIWLDTVGSTLDELHARAAAGAADGSWLVAAEQTAGRGSRGRAWHSPRGGLWLSVLRRAPGAFAGFELLSIRAGLAVAEVLDGLPAVAPVMLKWPNDLVVRDLKVGGLLAEARWQGDRLLWVAIGLGLNVRNAIPAELAGRATSLSAYCSDTTVEALAEPIARALASVDLDTPELSAEELSAYAARDWLMGRLVTAPIEGTGAGVGKDGRLAVRDASGELHRVSLGDVLAS
jgi:BirA family biotin operon repressor/biotin-[acetyl-CoA-carboxylase] ligase